MQDETKPSFIISQPQPINITIPLSEDTPALSLQQNNTLDLVIPLSDQTPRMTYAQTIYPHLAGVTDIKIAGTQGTITPVSGSQTNFAIGWWLYVNDQPFVPNNTNFGPGWFMYVNSR